MLPRETETGSGAFQNAAHHLFRKVQKQEIMVWPQKEQLYRTQWTALWQGNQNQDYAVSNSEQNLQYPQDQIFSEIFVKKQYSTIYNLTQLASAQWRSTSFKQDGGKLRTCQLKIHFFHYKNRVSGYKALYQIKQSFFLTNWDINSASRPLSFFGGSPKTSQLNHSEKLNPFALQGFTMKTVTEDEKKLIKSTATQQIRLLQKKWITATLSTIVAIRQDTWNKFKKTSVGNFV